ncbi:hypothetical protein ACN27G_01490 [Plantactinospora sp. WMMB334]|uniref:hypothetical protein n=1 Tax=Plantactinospora sp. WMMB334 TaxID=3404119 RepID=UPI003B944ADA
MRRRGAGPGGDAAEVIAQEQEKYGEQVPPRLLRAWGAFVGAQIVMVLTRAWGIGDRQHEIREAPA